jgi:hypothetical protein
VGLRADLVVFRGSRAAPAARLDRADCRVRADSPAVAALVGSSSVRADCPANREAQVGLRADRVVFRASRAAPAARLDRVDYRVRVDSPAAVVCRASSDRADCRVVVDRRVAPVAPLARVGFRASRAAPARPDRADYRVRADSPAGVVYQASSAQADCRVAVDHRVAPVAHHVRAGFRASRADQVGLRADRADFRDSRVVVSRVAPVGLRVRVDYRAAAQADLRGVRVDFRASRVVVSRVAPVAVLAPAVCPVVAVLKARRADRVDFQANPVVVSRVVGHVREGYRAAVGLRARRGVRVDFRASPVVVSAPVVCPVVQAVRRPARAQVRFRARWAARRPALVGRAVLAVRRHFRVGSGHGRAQRHHAQERAPARPRAGAPERRHAHAPKRLKPSRCSRSIPNSIFSAWCVSSSR